MTLSKLLLSLASLTLSFSVASESAFVTLSGAAPFEFEGQQQPLTVYACNNTAVPLEMKWTEENLEKLPYGTQSKDGKNFFISKYYVASPPLPNSFSSGQPLILGVLSVDHFEVTKAGQNIDIFMDYERLKPIELGYLTVDYTAGDDDVANCADQGINTIPINIRCPSFEYREGNKVGLGKGIAQLSRNTPSGGLSDKGQLFIPLDIENKQALEGCTVKIVNDIILDHQIYFGTTENHEATIDLTQAYIAYKNNKTPVNLFCRSRPKNQPAEGCHPILPKQ